MSELSLLGRALRLRVRWPLLAWALGGVLACGPDGRPKEPCEGPTFTLSIRPDRGILPADTTLSVKYGGDSEGEVFALDGQNREMAVFCTPVFAETGGGSSEDDAANGAAGASSAGAGGQASAPAAASSQERVQSLDCLLYTQGPARLDVSASGFVKVEERELKPAREGCAAPVEIVLETAGAL